LFSVLFFSCFPIGMTDPETRYPLIRWPVQSTTNFTGVYNKTQENYQIFQPPPPPPTTLLTYFQTKDQFST